ncbi:MAG TPA: glycosyltransferase family 2 protein [Deltaproteobacteria bacterium]|nr:glycosyltransferase family 2 protein [Deltaproteobacteria bacterium]HOI05881.1 glycosyltransferase family 2 protein [Deltaproteobacteria bacterium]
MEQPLLSIVTPSYNQAGFLEEAILSVLAQDYPHIEYIIIDGGSTDGSIDIIRKHAGHLTSWVSEPDAGQCDAINKGWRMSSGDIVAWLNADDTYCPGAVSTVVDLFRRNPGTVLVHGGANTCDREGRRVLFTKRPAGMDPYGMIAACGGVSTQPSVFLSRAVLEDVGYLDPGLHYVMDWEYWIRIGLRYGTGAFVRTDAVLSNNRDWPGTKTNEGWREIPRENRKVLDRLFRTHPHDARLAGIRDKAYRSSYRKEAHLARVNGEPLEALSALYRAWSIGPLSHNPARELALLAYIILGRGPSRMLRHVLGPVRSTLNRIVGY